MSNTWNYRFAFRAERRDDVPAEFRNMYERLLVTCGPPRFGLFSPAMEDPGFIFSRWLPPKLLVVFSESLALLSLDTRSDQVQIFELSRLDFLGCSLGEFLLKCWFTLYPGPAADGGVQIRFPSRASQHYVELARFLLNWSDWGDETLPNPLQSSRLVSGLPPKFSSFLEAHAEFGPASEFFFQPAMELRKGREERWPNVLLLITRDSIVVLTDQHGGEYSQYGVEMARLPLRRVVSVEWADPNDGHESAIAVCLRGARTELRLSWPVYSGLKPYAFRWLEAVESSVKTLGKVVGRGEGWMQPHEECTPLSNSVQGRAGDHGHSGSD